MSYTQSYYHIVFRTKHSEPTIPTDVERLLYHYLYTISENKGCKVFRIGGMPDHVHLFISLPSTLALSMYVKQLKESSSRWLCQNPQFPLFDGWATGYAALSYSRRDKDMIVNYIMNQKKHHEHKTFREEYQQWLEEEGIEINHDYFLND